MGIEENVWSSEVSDAPAAVAPEVAFPGGELPPVVDLLAETFNDLKDHPGPYLLASVGVLCLMLPLTFMMVGVGMAPMVAAVILEEEILLLVGYLGLLGAILAMVVASGPINASLIRGFWAWHEEGEEPSFGMVFKRLTPGLVSVLLLSLLTVALGTLGLFACYVGALVVSLLLVFALPAVAIHRLGPVDAIRLSTGHARAHFSWHLGLWGLGFAIVMVGSYIPLIGAGLAPVFYYAYLTRAYRRVFGNGEVPYGWTG